MNATERRATAGRLLADFAARTGLHGTGDAHRRYLWTDAFAVESLLALHERTGDPWPRDVARRLVDLVHHVLGRHRPDDARHGWLSGMSEAEGERHPTAGGLRIGKPLPERPAGCPIDARLEWERDGQYFHYLTRWMAALERTARSADEPEALRWACELARVAHAAFVHRAPDGTARIHWKMSIDLARPLVVGSGVHDPIDGLAVTDVLSAARGGFGAPDVPSVAREAASYRRICDRRRWITDDPLGIGGLLVAAGGLLARSLAGDPGRTELATWALADAATGLRTMDADRMLERPVGSRLAFRELGLAIGLETVAPLASAVRAADDLARRDAILAGLDAVLAHRGLVARIEGCWADRSSRRTEVCDHRRDIDEVMLAASLLRVGAGRWAGVESGGLSVSSDGPSRR